jgi:hypothetical protein
MFRSGLKALVVSTSLVGVIPLVVGCAHTDPMKEPAKPVSQMPRPAWVDKGSGAYPGEKSKIFAVGIAPAGVDDESLARETADDDGRVQLQRVFEVYIAALMERYKRSTTVGGQGKTENDVKSVSRSLTEGTLHGSQISDHWHSPQNNTWYSLVVIDLASFKEFVEQAKDLDASFKEFIRSNADNAQGDLDKRLAEKHAAQ